MLSPLTHQRSCKSKADQGVFLGKNASFFFFLPGKCSYMKAAVGAGFYGNGSAADTVQMASMKLFYCEQRCLSGALTSICFSIGPVL